RSSLFKGLRFPKAEPLVGCGATPCFKGVREVKTVKIVELFADLVGVSAEEGMAYYALCKGAEESLRVMLVDKNSEVLYENELCRAAAALAYYRYVLVKTAKMPSGGYQIKDIHVGGVSAVNTEAARILWVQALNDIKDLVKDTDFVFRRI
ncbi:MAG: hypothetical protein ACI4M3_04645, partial [Acutalibacteraceae bacterium]